MRYPLAAWRAGVRWPLLSLASIATLAIVVGACEAAGWPFLVTPVQQWLAKALDRRVVFDGDAAATGAVRIGLVGSVRVAAPSLEIGAPPWSSSPRMLVAHDVQLKLGYLDLWRAWRGAPLNVADLEAADLDAALERSADGRTSWQFGRRAAIENGDAPTAFPTFGQLRVAAGHLSYDDAILPASIDARFALSDGDAAAEAPASSGASGGGASATANGIVVRAGRLAASATASNVSLPSGARGLKLQAVGRYRKQPLHVDLQTSGVLRMLLVGKAAEAQPLKLLASIAGADLSFDGSTTDPLHFAGLRGRFRLSGPSLATVGDVLGITLPTTPPFKTNGSLAKDGKVWSTVFEAAAIGSSRLTGAFTYDQRPKVPVLAGRLGGARLVLADLGPAVGTPVGNAPATTRDDRVIPDKRFDLPSLRAMDANVLVDIAMFDPGTTLIEPLRPVHAHILLADGVLTVADFDGDTADGRIVGFLQLDGRGGQALWTADMRMLGVDLARWLRLERKGNAPPYLSGRLDALVKVKGAGRSTAEILGSLDGDIRAHVRDGAVSHIAIEVAGVDVAQALGVYIKGDDALPLLCNVADLDVVKGVARPKVFIVNTKDSTVWIDGTVSLKTEGLELRAVVSPKDFSPLTLRTPIHVGGVLGRPAVSLEKGKLAAKAAAAVLLALLNPIAAVIPFVDPGARDAAHTAAAQCAALAPTSGAIPHPALAPHTLHVPPPSAPRSASAPT
jgi:AsmA family protein